MKAVLISIRSLFTLWKKNWRNWGRVQEERWQWWWQRWPWRRRQGVDVPQPSPHPLHPVFAPSTGSEPESRFAWVAVSSSVVHRVPDRGLPRERAKQQRVAEKLLCRRLLQYHAASETSRFGTTRLWFDTWSIIFIQSALSLLHAPLLHPHSSSSVVGRGLFGRGDGEIEVAVVRHLERGEGGQVVVRGGGGREGGGPVQERGEVPPETEPAVRRRRTTSPVWWRAPLTGVRFGRGERMGSSGEAAAMWWLKFFRKFFYCLLPAQMRGGFYQSGL